MYDCHRHITREPSQGGAIVCATREDQWRKLLELANGSPAVLPCIGIHPWELDSCLDGWEHRMKSCLAENPHAWVGEVGLDKSRCAGDSRELPAFQQQLRIAADLKRPVVVHCVKRWKMLLETLSLVELENIVVHGFSGSADVADALVHMGAMLSFGPMLLRSEKVQGVLKNVPLEHVLLESDCIVKDENETMLEQVYTMASRCLMVSLDEMVEVVNRNLSGLGVKNCQAL